MLHLMVTQAICHEMAFEVVFQSPIEFLMKVLSVMSISYGSKHFSICVWHITVFFVVSSGSTQIVLPDLSYWLTKQCCLRLIVDFFVSSGVNTNPLRTLFMH